MSIDWYRATAWAVVLAGCLAFWAAVILLVEGCAD